ncbi:unnamed protein product [Kuraishia capsulata CBS 1993]|uniref:candidapepsin n=1 Tax=Kuraishia capsulata CBS 1993 TaxID=1382522 RepID=W6MSM3_9ASCO|nr:uncharacterized protein KUCA_T00004204001 [Kuraishia capsulata CBS 1993]CDK28222.1 unnamed protein product [Kuraishia capsulata CBS 1993]
MRLALLLTLAACCCAKKVVKQNFDVIRGDSAEDAVKFNRPKLVKRDDSTAEMVLINAQTFFMTNVTIGTPGQSMGVLVDTGSSDLWVQDVDNEYCDSTSDSSKRRVVDIDAFEFDKRDDIGGGELGGYTETVTGSSTADASIPTFTSGCNKYGGLDTSKSKSFKKNDTIDFAISYADSTAASGYWAHDVVNVAGVDVKDLSFAVANVSNSSFGVLGIGLTGLEATYVGSTATSSNHYQYLNLPYKMAANGLINTPAYSVFLNTASSSEGSVLFGGVDHSKYTGSLETVAIINTYAGYVDSPIRLEITLSGLTIASGDNEETLASGKFAALLDTGSTITYLPLDLLEAIANTIGASYSSSIGYYYFDCSIANDYKFTFDFTGAKIQASLSNFTLVGQGFCALGVSYSGDDSVILGDNFISNAYVVYDLENEQISIAQADFSGGSEDIEEIDSSGVPSAVKAASYSSTWTSDDDVSIATSVSLEATSNGGIVTASSGSAASTKSGSSGSSSKSSKSSSGSKTTSSSSSSSSSNTNSKSEGNSLKPTAMIAAVVLLMASAMAL